MLRVEKVLQGDPDDVREPYTKMDDEKGMKKAKAKVNEVCQIISYLNIRKLWTPKVFHTYHQLVS